MIRTAKAAPLALSLLMTVYLHFLDNSAAPPESNFCAKHLSRNASLIVRMREARLLRGASGLSRFSKTRLAQKINRLLLLVQAAIMRQGLAHRPL